MKKSILNTSIKACNGYGLTLNALWIFASLLYIIWFLRRNSNLTKIQGKVVNKEEINICKTNDNDFSFLNMFTGKKSHCILEIEYMINNKKDYKIIEYNKCNDLNIKDDISLSYDNDNKEIIIDEYNQILKKIFYFVIIFMLVIILFTFLRIFYSDNKWMKIYISLQCFLPG